MSSSTLHIGPRDPRLLGTALHPYSYVRDGQAIARGNVSGDQLDDWTARNTERGWEICNPCPGHEAAS